MYFIGLSPFKVLVLVMNLATYRQQFLTSETDCGYCSLGMLDMKLYYYKQRFRMNSLKHPLTNDCEKVNT